MTYPIESLLHPHRAIPIVIFLFATLCLCAAPLSAATLHVDKRHAVDVPDGSPAKPYGTVQAAVDAAASGDTIKVAAADYDETVTIKNRTLLLYGGFAGGGDFTTQRLAIGPTTRPSTQPATPGPQPDPPDPRATTLHGSGKDSVVVLMNAGETVIDGFRITGGVGRNGTGGGAGVFISGGAVTISHNLIEDNKTSSQNANGAGIYFNNQTDLKILNNIIRNNHGGHGPGIAGGGEKVLIRGNVILNNIATGDHGGGVYCSAKSSEIDDNYVSGNSATLYGGGILCFGIPGTPGKPHHQARITNNVVTDNLGFGAIYIDDGGEGFIQNNLVYRNYNGIYVDGPDTVAVIDHCTMAYNGVTSHGPIREKRYGVGLVVEQASTNPNYVKVTVTNCIMFGNWGGDFLPMKAPSDTTISYCLTEKPLPAAAKTNGGNIVGDPLFADAEKNDFHLKSKVGRWRAKGWVVDEAQSPGIDAGDPAADFSKEPAPNGGRVNLGFDGNTPQASKSGTSSPGPRATTKPAGIEMGE